MHCVKEANNQVRPNPVSRNDSIVCDLAPMNRAADIKEEDLTWTINLK